MTSQTVILPSDKASIIHAIEAAKLPVLADAHAQSKSVASVAAPSVPRDERETTDRAPRVLIIDALAVVQCIKKTPIMTSIVHLKTACTAIIERVVIEYMEVRVFFDRYVEVSLKQNTRKKRVTLCCCHDCWACSARWHVNQYDLIETTVVVHVRP